MTLCFELITQLNQVNFGLFNDIKTYIYVFAAGCDQLGSVQKRKIDTFYIDNPAPITKSKSYQEKFFHVDFLCRQWNRLLKKKIPSLENDTLSKDLRRDLLRRSWLNPSWIIWQIWLSSYNNSENVFNQSPFAINHWKLSKLNHCPLFGYHVLIDRLVLNYGNVFDSQSTALFLFLLSEK